MRYTHIFPRESNYSSQFISLLAIEHYSGKHTVVFRSVKNKSYSYPQEISNSIIYIENHFQVIKNLLPLLFKSDFIFIHSLIPTPALAYWFLFKSLSRRTVWKIWGADLYFYNKKKNSTERIYEFFRKQIVKHFPYIIAPIEGDYLLAKEVYKAKARYLMAVYPLPVHIDQLSLINDEEIKANRNILVGNSGNEANNHIQILQELSILKDEDINIICPLSYGGASDYVEKVVSIGRSIFGTKFKPLLKLLPPHEYNKILDTCSVAIMNHSRQQGLGSIFPLLYAGRKVYLRGDTTTFAFLKKLNIKVFASENISNENYSSIFSMDYEQRISNSKITKLEFSEERTIRRWRDVFKTLETNDNRN